MLSIETKKNTNKEIGRFRESIVSWFRREGRTYPWRETRDPYAILVSELMLQQTRIATVLERGYFERWMKAFPTWKKLAEADTAEVLKVWEGLGYYNRARNLQKAAQVVVSSHGGVCPESLERVLELPGVGRYTAGAVMSFAFEKRAPIVDGNVVRVLSRVCGFSDPVDSSDSQNRLWALADQLTPEREVREYNSGLMEIGQRVCHRRNPECSGCPIREFCTALKDNKVDEIPLKKKKTEITPVVEHVALLRREGRVFLHPETGKRRNGLWRLPEISADSASDCREILRFFYSITRYKVDLRIYSLESESALALDLSKRDPGGDWFRVDHADGWPALAAPYRKAILRFLEISDDLTGR
jgi:A/G-specific adenine glycosylase